MSAHESRADRRAWNTYWALFGIFVVTLVGMAAASGRGPLWAFAVAVPCAAAGLSLVLASGSHERICSIEVQRHAWLGAITMGGYDRRTFAVTGAAMLAGAVTLGYWVATR